MKALQIAVVVGVLLSGAMSSDARSLLQNRDFIVLGVVNTAPIAGVAHCSMTRITGAYWDEMGTHPDELEYIPFILFYLPEGSPGIEFMIDERSSVAIARRTGFLMANYGPLQEVDAVDFFYVWLDGQRVHFLCIATWNSNFFGILFGTEL